MKILHLLAAGGTGGIETLCRDYAKYSKHDNTFVFVWGYNGKTYLEMKNRGDDAIQLNASKINPIETLKKIDCIRKDKGAQIIIVHHAAPLLYLYLMLVKKDKQHIRTIIYAHGNAVDMYHVHEKRGLFFRKTILKLALRKCDQIIAISQSVKKSLVEYLGTPESKIQTIYNGVDTSRFSANNKANMIEPINMIYVGRLIWEKGVQVTIKALSKLPKDIKWRFQIVGDGNYRQNLEELVNRLNLTSRISFLGTRSDVPQLFNNADIFIHMPIWEEGFGIAIVEAMAAGLVCICANSGAISEIIRDGVNGYLVEKENENVLAQRIACAVRDGLENKLQILSEQAVSDARSFSVEKFVNQLDDIM